MDCGQSAAGARKGCDMARIGQGDIERDAETRRKPRRGFLQSEDGSFIIFGLLLLILMVVSGGMSVDFMRFETHRGRLQATLDRAVLAAASLDQPLEPTEVVLDYFKRDNLEFAIDAGDISVTQSATSRRVEACASIKMGTTFMSIPASLGGFEIDSLNAGACSAAEESASQTEISLVLDVSGSMSQRSRSGRSKLDDLQSAAKTFINIVLCDPANPSSTTCTVAPGKVSVNVVPYSEQVLVGQNLLSKFNATQEHNDSSCVTFDEADFHDTAITPTQILKRTGHFDPWSRWRDKADDWTCQTDEYREITPIGSNAADLRDAIDDLRAYGNTSIDLGVKWGAALLDPAAQPVVTNLIDKHFVDDHYRGRPLAYTERGVEKVLVVMTDGVNTDQHYLYDYARSGDSPVWVNLETKNGNLRRGNRYSIYNEDNGLYYWEDERRWEDHPYGSGSYQVCSWRWGCYTVNEGDGAEQMTYVELWDKKPWDWYDRWNWLSSPGSSVRNSEKNDRLQDICDAAKAKDMTIFSIGFEVTGSSGDVLRDCASTPAHYFNVDGLDLSDAFAAIAREISKLRLVN